MHDTDKELKIVIDTVQKHMDQYNFNFIKSEYTIDRIMGLEEKLIMAYLKEYLPDVEFFVDIFYIESDNDMYAMIRKIYGGLSFKVSVNNWRLNDD